MKRRIQVTRERWTRFSIRGGAAPDCPHACSSRELMTVVQAARLLTVQPGTLSDLLAAGRIAMFPGPAGPLICVSCARDLIARSQVNNQD